MPALQRHFYRALLRPRLGLETLRRKGLSVLVAAEKFRGRATRDRCVIRGSVMRSLNGGRPRHPRKTEAAWRIVRRHLSFPYAKLSEDRVENLFDIHGANYLSDRAQCFVQIYRNVFRRQPIAHR